MNFRQTTSVTGTIVTVFTGLSIAISQDEMLGITIIGLLMFNAGIGFELLERTKGDTE